MPKPTRRPETPVPTGTTALRDEAVRKLLDACETRFPSPDFEVMCDERSTVWVKQTDGLRSIGLPPWLLRRHTLDELIARAERKLEPRAE